MYLLVYCCRLWKKEADKADKIYYYGNSDGIEAEITAFSDYREYLLWQ